MSLLVLNALAGKEADQLSFTLCLLGGSKQSTDSRYRPVDFYARSISGVEVCSRTETTLGGGVSRREQLQYPQCAAVFTRCGGEHLKLSVASPAVSALTISWARSVFMATRRCLTVLPLKSEVRSLTLTEATEFGVNIFSVGTFPGMFRNFQTGIW